MVAAIGVSFVSVLVTIDDDRLMEFSLLNNVDELCFRGAHLGAEYICYNVRV